MTNPCNMAAKLSNISPDDGLGPKMHTGTYAGMAGPIKVSIDPCGPTLDRYCSMWAHVDP